MDLTVGSVCSGIEAASLAWTPLGMEFKWFSEIEDFPSRVLKEKYPTIDNLGDMIFIPDLIKKNKIYAPDIICGGTPCQAFSLAGLKQGLNDDRGNLTLKFVQIAEENDRVRKENGLDGSVIFWENVEGVLTDKTNAFGSLVSSLAGLESVIKNERWPRSGIIRGPKRNVAWRVIDSKYFGLPQQRRRVYLIAGPKTFYPENVLFEKSNKVYEEFKSKNSLYNFKKDNTNFGVFREYTDTVYAAYGTKWNGNAAAYNGSLFVVQDNKIRRFSPLETERLMGFPDNYTKIEKASRTNRYKAIGNSWSVPVIEWIGENIKLAIKNGKSNFDFENKIGINIDKTEDYVFLSFISDFITLSSTEFLNVSAIKSNPKLGDLKNIVSVEEIPKRIYISPVGASGMVRRKYERNLNMNPELLKILKNTSDKMSEEEIEKLSMRQQRSKVYGTTNKKVESKKHLPNQLSLFDSI